MSNFSCLKDCMIGFVFCDESEADAFHKKVKKRSKASKRSQNIHPYTLSFIY